MQLPAHLDNKFNALNTQKCVSTYEHILITDFNALKQVKTQHIKGSSHFYF